MSASESTPGGPRSGGEPAGTWTEFDQPPDSGRDGLVLRPFRGLRPTADGRALAGRLSPPYDVIDEAERARLLDRDPTNAVAVVLPRPDGTEDDPYRRAASTLTAWVGAEIVAVDDAPAVYVYEMAPADGSATRGLVGAVALRDPAERVILPHENTMAGPVADRLALMRATQANLEMIYLVYDGGGPASAAVAAVDEASPLSDATTPDGVRHRLWAITEADTLAAIAQDLRGRSALIADGHHRYATYRTLQEEQDRADGAGPWDFGLTLLVDATGYGPSVHAIHRVIHGVSLDETLRRLEAFGAGVSRADDASAENPSLALASLADRSDFGVVVTDGVATAVVTDPHATLRDAARGEGEPEALADLDVTVLHRGLIAAGLGLTDSEQTVGYAHSVEEAVQQARQTHGVAVLLRPTPVAAVAAVAAEGARMPRKSTLFTPKPASGLIMRRFADE